jgi:formate hydrogenlyase subunit 3/multisubunit Na+/H+ antiporter MnhD subunit
MNLLMFIYIPSFTCLLCLLFTGRIKFAQEVCTIVGSSIFLVLTLQIINFPDQSLRIAWFEISTINFALDFKLYHFSRFILLFLGLFTLLTTIYSISYFKNKEISSLYYPFLSLTLAGSSMIVLADNFFVLLLGWEVVTLLLYYLINMGKGKSASMAAGKTFAILGFTDVALLFGVLALSIFYGTWNISELNIQVNDTLSTIIFILLFTAAIAKAGAMPFHSWIPESTQTAPLPVIAFLPASLDKLLGIYLLARLSIDVFQLSQAMLTLMLILGGITLIAANIMALIQNDLKKFLGFATITQVGYMLIGFGSGTTIGIIGGLFHMLNHAIYKTLLFFGVGVIERETGTTEMNKLGGLAKSMPYTFGLMTIGIMAASGIPPFNAFVSKWLIYQSTLEADIPLFLIIAMFGSAITLATFLKMWFGTFLGLRHQNITQKIKDGSLITKSTMSILALLCVVFGIFAQLPINYFIGPILNQNFGNIPQTINVGTAFYNPSLATLFLIIGLMVGLMIFVFSRIPKRKVDSLFIGGENFNIKSDRFIADHLYETLTKFNFLGTAAREGGKGIIDLYNLSSNIGLVFVNVLKKIHDGVLSTYLSWCVIGLGILCFVLVVLQSTF